MSRATVNYAANNVHCWTCGSDFKMGNWINETCPICRCKPTMIERIITPPTGDSR